MISTSKLIIHKPFRSFLALCFLLFFSQLSPAEEGVTNKVNHKFLGNVTCGNAFCHEAKEPWKTSSVQQNEFITWSKKDAHNKAYQSLLSDQAKRIAQKLNLRKPAHEEKQCLDCHANNASSEQQTRTFDIADGVSCESCHGPADHWLEVHVSGAGTHNDNLMAGMFPTEDPIKRATLCMSCHLGNEKKFVSHRMIGAGHPRLVFELDTYTAAEPAHYYADNEYKKRKMVASAIQTWAVGQAISVQLMMNNMTEPSVFKKASYPELSFFDCNACHHKMSDKRWNPKQPYINGPGVPRLNTANLLMLEMLTKRVAPAMSERLSKEIFTLHKSVTKSEDQTTAAATALKSTASQLLDKFSDYSFSYQDLTSMLGSLVADNTNKSKYIDYISAEQATLAIATLVSGLHHTGAMNDQTFKLLDRAMDPIYRSVESDENYKSTNFISALVHFNDIYHHLNIAALKDNN